MIPSNNDFSKVLDRLRFQAIGGIKGRMLNETVVSKSDLSDLLFHFDRLDAKARNNHAQSIKAEAMYSDDRQR